MRLWKYWAMSNAISNIPKEVKMEEEYDMEDKKKYMYILISAVKSKQNIDNLRKEIESFKGKYQETVGFDAQMLDVFMGEILDEMCKELKREEDWMRLCR